jgi:hypothetical protein
MAPQSIERLRTRLRSFYLHGVLTFPDVRVTRVQLYV